MTKSKRQSDPRQSLNVPRKIRTRVKGRISENTIIRGNSFANTITTDSGGALCGAVPLIAGNVDWMVASGMSGVSALYNTYRYLPGTMMHWVPQVSMSTTGVVYVAWVDNPEIFKNWYAIALTGVTANMVAFVKSIGNVKSYPIWQQFSQAMHPVMRRKRFDVNTTVDLANSDTLDRCLQGAWLYAVEGGPASSVVARPYRYGVLDLEGLMGAAGT